MNLGFLAVAKGRFVLGHWGVGIRLEFDVENRGVNSASFAEGADDDGCLERLGRQKELDGEILLGLYCAEPLVSKLSAIPSLPCHEATHNRYHRLAGVLDRQGEGSLKASLLLLDGHKGLVWPLCLAIFLRSQDDLDGIGASKSNGFRKRGLLAESAQTDVSNWCYAEGA